MQSMFAVLNVNRLFVLAILKVTDARRKNAEQEWDTEAIMPEGAWSSMSGYLFMGALTAEGLAIGVLILASIVSGGNVPLYFIYLGPFLPLICGISGEVECRIGQMRAERTIRRTGQLLYDEPQFDVHIVKNDRVLLKSSIIGLFIAFSVAFPLAVLNPLR
jgi:hypothetical protein